MSTATILNGKRRRDRFRVSLSSLMIRQTLKTNTSPNIEHGYAAIDWGSRIAGQRATRLAQAAPRTLLHLLNTSFVEIFSLTAD